MALKEKRRGGALDETEMFINYSRSQLMEMLERQRLECERQIEQERRREEKRKKRGRR